MGIDESAQGLMLEVSLGQGPSSCRDNVCLNVVKGSLYQSSSMGVRARSVAIPDVHEESPMVDGVERAAIQRELEAIVRSSFFRGSSRGKQFLAYVVQHKLEGHDELLKERTIGTELFRRPVDYATGDDPVVRVQAGEVRRRLEQYYNAVPNGSKVRITLPVGSYVPEFQGNQVEHPVDSPLAESEPAPLPRKRFPVLWTVVVIGLVSFAAVSTMRVRRKAGHESVLEQFWSPVFASPQAVLICLSKPVFYRPSLDLYRRYSKTHTGTFTTEVERLNRGLPLNPREKILWGDMVPFTEFGVAAGDVYAANRLTQLFGRINKPSQFRIGNEYSFDDLRNSPAVLVGAFSNWGTLEITANLRFVFAEKEVSFWIQDREAPNRTWRGEDGEDFGIVTRLLDSKTGQLVITVAGLAATGSDAAAQLISNSEYLHEGLRGAPPDWQKKNMQVVVQTHVINGVAGPPHVVATYFW